VTAKRWPGEKTKSVLRKGMQEPDSEAMAEFHTGHFKH